jgi:hypothetical protein
MPLIAQTLKNANAFRSQFGEEPNSTWTTQANNVLILRDNGVTLEYTTMNDSVQVKQADVILDTYPLAYTSNYTLQDSLTDMNYVRTKTITKIMHPPCEPPFADLLDSTPSNNPTTVPL